MSRAARFEIVTTARDQHHARFIAPNGRIVWVTETYKRRRGAENAVCTITGRFLTPRPDGNAWVSRPHRNDIGSDWLEVRYIDDRPDEAADELRLQAGTLPAKGECHVCGKQVSGERRFCGQCLRKRGRL